jgi:uncharacterized protein DUF4279
MADEPEIRACLLICGSFDPHDLDRLLGVEASIHRAGEIRRSGSPREEDSWHFQAGPSRSFDWPAQLDKVLAVVRPHLDDFLAFCDSRSLYREIHLISTMTMDGTPIGAFTADQVADVARLGCALDIDLYVSRGDYDHTP